MCGGSLGSGCVEFFLVGPEIGGFGLFVRELISMLKFIVKGVLLTGSVELLSLSAIFNQLHTFY